MISHANTCTPLLDLSRVRAITLDLDDTLWPVWPTIERAEQALRAWLLTTAPATAALLAVPETARAIRAGVVAAHPQLSHDLSALRRESIRAALHAAGEDTALAERGYEVFFAERQRVDLYEDALETLECLAARHPLVALSNGNADIQLIGIGQYFRASVSAREFGVAKPDARIFLAAAEAAGVAPHEVLHVGDDAAMDAQGAVAAGMQAVWINRTGKPWPLDDTHLPHATVTDLRGLCALWDAVL